MSMFLGSDNLSASAIVPGSSLPLVSGRKRARAPLTTADPPKMIMGSHTEAADSAATYGLSIAPTLAHIELNKVSTLVLSVRGKVRIAIAIGPHT